MGPEPNLQFLKNSFDLVNKNRWLFILASTLIMFSSCALPQKQSKDSSDVSGVFIEDAEVVAAREGHLPVSYKNVVDQRLSDILIDPDSRKVAFLSNPYGGLVCGTVNSRNTYGGYTGKQPMYATFDAKAMLVGLETFDPTQMELYHNFMQPYKPGYRFYKLLWDCNFYTQ